MNLCEADYQELIEVDDPDAIRLAPNLALLEHVEVALEVRIGAAAVSIAELFALRAGQVLALDREVEEPVEVFLNGRRIAAGHLAVADDRLGVRITEIDNGDTRLAP